MNETEPNQAPSLKTVEEIATSRGHLPQMLPQPAIVMKGKSAAVPAKFNKSTWKLTAAMRRFGWTNATEIDESEYDKAIKSVCAEVIR